MEKRDNEALENELKIMKIGLVESVKLQSHYADLLNMYDGGERMTFQSSEEWLRRLADMGKFE